MFNEPELTPDLEWLLQSNQAAPQVLAEALVEAFFEKLFNIAYLLFPNREAAWDASVEAIAAMLNGLYRYKAGTSPEKWARRIAIERYSERLQRGTAAAPPEEPAVPGSTRDLLSSLTADQRLALVLASQGWERQEIARAMHTNERLVSAWLDTASGRLVPGARQREPLPEALRSLQAEEMLPPALEAQDLEEAARQSLSRSEQAAARTRYTNRVKESLWIALAAVLIVVIAWSLNRFLPEVVPSQPPAPTLETPDPLPASSRPYWRTSRPPVHPTPTRAPYSPPFPEEAFYQVRPGDTWNSIAAQLGSTVAELLRLNRIPPGSRPDPAEPLLIPGILTPGPRIEPTPLPEEEELPPLTVASTYEEIVARAEQYLNGRIKTLWIDQWMRMYGPQGYAGPPQEYRIQVWISMENNHFLFLAGPASEKPAEVMLGLGEQGYRALPGEGIPWFTDPGSEEALMRSGMILLLNYAFASISLRSGTDFPEFQLQEYEVSQGPQVAGRDTLRLDLSGVPSGQEGTFFVDTQTGLVLGQNILSTSQQRSMRLESRVGGFETNVPFPQDLMDPWLPWRGSYARDASGAPEAGDRRPEEVFSSWDAHEAGTAGTPGSIFPGEAVSESALADNRRLTFVTGDPYNLFDPDNPGDYQMVDILAGKTLLGSVPMPNPINIICARSPDGNFLAYANSWPEDYTVDGELNWVRLDDTITVFQPLPGRKAKGFSFSPDNRHLAVILPDAGRSVFSVERDWGLYIVDTTSGGARKIATLDSETPPIWNSDGSLLAIMSPGYRRYFSNKIYVMDSENGEYVYTGEPVQDPNTWQFSLPKSWPYPDWEPDLNRVMGGLESCAYPPE